MLEPTRQALLQTGRPYVIENVPGAPLHNPVELCGSMFGLETYRHRWFEFGGPGIPDMLAVPIHQQHHARTAKMGRPVMPGEYMHIVGNFSGVAKAREVMGMEWASRDGLREAIPPAYTEWIARAVFDHLGRGIAVEPKAGVLGASIKKTAASPSAPMSPSNTTELERR